MDFLTVLPYIGIAVLILLNALIVSRMNINISDPSEAEFDD